MSIAHKNVYIIIRGILSKQHIKRVWFAGCGDLLTGFWPGKYFLDYEAKKLAVGYVTSNELVHAMPNALGKNSVAVLVSQQGNIAETVEAAHIAHQKGAATIGLVYTPGTPLCEHSDYTTGYRWMRYPETVDPTQQKAAYSLRLALEVLAQTERYVHYDQTVNVFASFESVVRGAQQQIRADTHHSVEARRSEKVVHMMSSGPSLDAVHQESICILLEMQRISSTGIHSGEYFHGPFGITETGMPFILLKNSGRTRPLDGRVVRFIEYYQGKLQIIDVEKVGIDTLHTSVHEYFCGLLHNCVLDAYSLALAIARNHPLTTRRYTWKVEY